MRNILLFQLTELGLSCYYDKKPEKIATEPEQWWTKKFQRNEERSKAIYSTTCSPVYLATYSNRGANVLKARVNCDLTVSKTEGNTHHTLQLWRQQGFYRIPKLLSTFFNHMYLAFTLNLHLTSTDSEKGNFLAGTFSILFPQSNSETEVWAPIHNQWRESVRDLVLQQLGHFYQLPWQSHG